MLNKFKLKVNQKGKKLFWKLKNPLIYKGVYLLFCLGRMAASREEASSFDSSSDV